MCCTTSFNGFEVTYAELVATNGNYVPFAVYKVTDFRTVHIIPNTVTTHIGAIETIYVVPTQSTQTVFDGYCENGETIVYTTTNYVGATLGTILRRINTEFNIDICFDFRECTFIRWADANGYFIVLTNNGNSTALYKSINITNLDAGGLSDVIITPNIYRELINTPDNFLSNSVVSSIVTDVYSVKIHESIGITILEDVLGFDAQNCTSVAVTGSVARITMKSTSNTVVIGNIENSSFSNVNHTNIGLLGNDTKDCVFSNINELSMLFDYTISDNIFYNIKNVNILASLPVTNNTFSNLSKINIDGKTAGISDNVIENFINATAKSLAGVGITNNEMSNIEDSEFDISSRALNNNVLKNFSNKSFLSATMGDNIIINGGSGSFQHSTTDFNHNRFYHSIVTDSLMVGTVEGNTSFGALFLNTANAINSLEGNVFNVGGTINNVFDMNNSVFQSIAVVDFNQKNISGLICSATLQQSTPLTVNHSNESVIFNDGLNSYISGNSAGTCTLTSFV